jgi:iron complex outermembrane recepter protein
MDRYGSAVLAVLLLLPAAAVEAQSDSRRVVGVVRSEEGDALPWAQVVLDAGRRAAVTDSEGRFAFGGIGSGRYRLDVSLIGYAPASREVVVEGAGQSTIEVELRRTVLSLPGLQVTATPFAGEARAVTQGTTQLSGRALEREMSGTLAQTLGSQPGLAVRSMGPGASAPIIRGLTGDRVLILQDGQRAGDLSGSADDHGVTIDPLAAQRVEVVRGPATLLYGNNALGGVVNVITSDLPTHLASRSEWALAAQSETAQPGGSMSVRASVPVAESVTMAVRLGGRVTDDVRIPGDPELGTRLPNTRTTSWSGSAGLGHVGERVVGGGTLKAYGFAYGLPAPPGGEEVSLRGSRYEVAGRAEAALGSRLFSLLRLDGTLQRYEHDELESDGDLAQRFGLDTGTMNVVVRQGGWGRVIREGAWGASGLLKSYAAMGPEALVPAVRSRGVGFFGFQEIGLGAGAPAVQAGARLDDYSIVSEGSEKFGTGRARSFRALSGSLGLRLPVREGVDLGVNGSRSFRAPTVEELFSGAAHAGTGSVEFGDPDLGAERGISAETVLRIRTDRWHGQLAAFRTEIRDFIHLAARGDSLLDGVVLPVLVYRQEDALLRGVEGQIEWAAGRDLAVGVTGDLLRAGLRDGTPLSFMPAAWLGSLLRWETGGYSLGLDLTHHFPQERVGTADELPTSAYTLVRSFAGFRWTSGRTVHSVTLRGENLGNVLYRESTSRVKEFAPGAGRNLALLYRVYF